MGRCEAVRERRRECRYSTDSPQPPNRLSGRSLRSSPTLRVHGACPLDSDLCRLTCRIGVPCWYSSRRRAQTSTRHVQWLSSRRRLAAGGVARHRCARASPSHSLSSVMPRRGRKRGACDPRMRSPASPRATACPRGRPPRRWSNPHRPTMHGRRLPTPKRAALSLPARQPPTATPARPQAELRRSQLHVPCERVSRLMQSQRLLLSILHLLQVMRAMLNPARVDACAHTNTAAQDYATVSDWWHVSGSPVDELTLVVGCVQL